VLRAWQLITHTADHPGYRKIQRPWDRDRAALFGDFQPTDQVRRAWDTVREAAEALGAGAVLFRTPASFTPTERNRRNMTAFFSGLERGPWKLVWDPEGVWLEEEVAALCHDLGLIPAQDPLITTLPAGPDFYFRMKTKTRGRGEYGPDDFYRMVDTAGEGAMDEEDDRDRIVIWNTPHPDRDAKNFRAWLHRTWEEEE